MATNLLGPADTEIDKALREAIYLTRRPCNTGCFEINNRDKCTHCPMEVACQSLVSIAQTHLNERMVKEFANSSNA